MNIFERLGRKLGIRMASKVAAEVGSEFIAKEFDNMTKTSDKIHVLADETLGGTLREYVEVEYGIGGRLALEPTGIVHIENERFRLVDRKAEVGERVIVVAEEMLGENHLGKVLTVVAKGGSTLMDTDGFWDDGSTMNLDPEDYRVLVPVESETSSPKSIPDKPESYDDIIANLVARVAELERFIAGQRSENQFVYDNIEGIKDDIVTWAQEVEKVRRTAVTAESNLDDLALRQRDHLQRLNAVDDKIEMVIDDIVTLDERTQPKKKGGCCGC